LQQVLEERLALTVEPLTVLGRIGKRRRVKLDEQDQAALVVPAGLCTGTSL